MKKATLFFAVFAVLAACSDDDPKPAIPEDGPNPIVPEVDPYPFPSDYYLVPDDSTATGRRVALDPATLPASLPTEAVDADGFSRLPLIVTYLPGGVDPSSLPALDDHAATVADDSPAFLIEEGTFERIPILVETDLGASSDAQRALIIRPLRLLAANKGYVVILRDSLRDPQGKAHTPSEAFVALRDGIPTKDPRIERQRESFELVNAAIDSQGLDPEEVVLAWAFHTRSASDVEDTLLALHDLVEEAELGEWRIVAEGQACKDLGHRGNLAVDRSICAEFEAPNFIDPETGLIARDAEGRPVQVGTRTVPFAITIPEEVQGPRPVVVYGHGFFGSYFQGTGGTINALSHTYGFTTVATYIGFSEDIMPIVLGSLGSNLANIRRAVAECQQNIANQTALARLVREVFPTSEELTVDGEDGPTAIVDDPAEVHYMGISNGGTFGFLTAATSTQFERAALVVGGGGLIHFLERSVVWNGYSGLFNLLYGNPLSRQYVLSVMQLLLDPVDPINYADHLVHDRYPGRRPLRALAIMALYDSQVRNLVSEWVARSADLPLVVPSPKDIYGLRTTNAEPPDGTDELGAFFVYDEQVEPTPLGNIPPEDDNDTHDVHKQPLVRQQLGEFLMNGKLVQFCEGACVLEHHDNL